MAVMLITQLNMLVAIELYRPGMKIWRALWHSAAVVIYIYGHWVPVIIVSFCQIMFGKRTSTWHPTEHGHESESDLLSA
jgi:hypothetical protein